MGQGEETETAAQEEVAKRVHHRRKKTVFIPFPTDAETDGKGRTRPDSHSKRQCGEFDGIWLATSHLEEAGGEGVR